MKERQRGGWFGRRDGAATEAPKATAQARLLRVRRRRRRRGVALILVLGSLTILTLVLSEMQDEVAVELGSALSDRDALRAEYAARSAINLSRLLIASEPTVRQAAGFLLAALQGGKGGSPPQIPVWEFGDQILGAFSDSDGAARFGSLTGYSGSTVEGLGLDGAGFEVQIVDEDAKIGLNKAYKSIFDVQDLGRQLTALMNNPEFDSLFEGRDADGHRTTRQDICSAIIDWVDANQDLENCNASAQAQSAPAEDSFYQNLPHPYQRKNAPFDSMEELRLVRGVSDEFWATFVEPRDGDPKQRPLSVWGGAKLNLNTASPFALLSQVCAAAVPGSEICDSPEAQASFVAVVRMAQGMFGGIPIFSSGQQLRAALEGKGQLASMLETFQIPKVQFIPGNTFEKGLTTESKVFSIYATGRVKEGKRETRVRAMAVVDFRKSPAVAAAEALLGAAGAGGRPGATAPDASQRVGAQGAVGSVNGIAAALTPSTGGEVVYFRIN